MIFTSGFLAPEKYFRPRGFRRLEQGLEPQTNTPEQFAELIRKETALNAKLIKTIGLKPE